jgi:ERCC4-type nuclease
MRAAASPPEPPLILIDSREQRPFEFDRSIRCALPTGDYSISGFADRVGIERKSKADAYSSIGHARERFHRAVERLAALDYGAIVIESTLPGFLIPPAHSQVSPQAALGTYLAWSVRYRLPVFFAGNHDHGQAVTEQLLRHYVRYAQGAENGD